MPLPPSLSTRLSSMARRLGLAPRGHDWLTEQAARLQLPFAPLPAMPDSVWWPDGAPLQRLADLPRGALSGPVQEDKACAHAALCALVRLEERELSEFDLRWIDGLGTRPPLDVQTCRRLEDYAATPACRGIRLISYKDFTRALQQALPPQPTDALHLRQASWRGERYFHDGERDPAALACAVAYARRRGLTMHFRARLSEYRLSRCGLDKLDRSHHVLAMPVETWSDARFMRLLLAGMPYARLSLLREPGAAEFLLLPRQHEASDALGAGLRQAGAADVIGWLRRLLPA